MLNGLDPIIIFNFFKKVTPEDEKKFKGLPVASFINQFSLPPIPIYLSEKITGIYVDSEEKNIDIATTTDTLFSGAPPEFQQKAISTSVKINMIASSESIGLSILSAMADQILPKVTSQEYSVIYIHKTTIILNGLLHAFSIAQEANSTLCKVTLELVNKPPNLGFNFSNDNPNQATLNNIGSAPAGGAAGSSMGSGSGPIPQASLPILAL